MVELTISSSIYFFLSYRIKYPNTSSIFKDKYKLYFIICNGLYLNKFLHFPDNIDTSLLQSDFLYATNVTLIQRRGSVPCENLSSANRNNCNGKTKNRKKMLRRRSSGGAEILCPIVAETEPSSSASSSWYRFKRSDASKNRSDLDMLLTRRRGSLPVEVLAVCHSGKRRI